MCRSKGRTRTEREAKGEPNSPGVIDPGGMFRFYNMDCIEGCKEHVGDGSVDLIVTDPPYGIEGHTLHKHYNRNEEFVIDGYIEVPTEQYAEFSRAWIAEAERILRPGAAMYVVSGYTHLTDILIALRATSLQEVNHLVWKYNFGVYTTRKYISSHYHILYYTKPGKKSVFNTFSRFGPKEKTPTGGSQNYLDREDVWSINREYKPGQRKNKNELPTQLLTKILQYNSNEGDLVCDLFLGSFSTAKVALALNRRALGFEKSKTAFDHQIAEIASIRVGALLTDLRVPDRSRAKNQGRPWTDSDKIALAARYKHLSSQSLKKKAIVETLCDEFGRGRFAVAKVLKELDEAGELWSGKQKGAQLEMY